LRADGGIRRGPDADDLVVGKIEELSIAAVAACADDAALTNAVSAGK